MLYRNRSGIAILILCAVVGVLIFVATDAINSLFMAMGDAVLRILGTLASKALNALRHF